MPKKWAYEEKVAHIVVEENPGGNLYILRVRGGGWPPQSLYFFSESAALDAAKTSGYRLINKFLNGRKIHERNS